MAQTNINISIDDNLKRQFNSICNELGLNMSTAFTIFAKATVQQQRIPFEISLDIPNAETIAAIEESERISHDPNIKGYTDIDKMMEELLL
jgi:DNA-damage-inducible protein J